jgi:flagellar M-ring protein FliF
VNEKVESYREKTILFWNKLTRQHKMMLIGSVILLLVTLIAVVYISSKTEYEVVYTNLAPQDAAGIKAFLDQNAIPYELNASGTAISVPEVNAAAVKLDLAASGLPNSGSIGYEIFRENMSSFGMTDAEFGVLERDALSGEMEKLIKNINGVSNAEVMITLPQESLFVNPQPETSTASVIVTLDPLAQLNQAQIKTLYQLVSRSVPKLPIANITISDQYGQLLQLNENADIGTTGNPNTIEQQLQLKKKFENDIQQNVQQLLGTLIGKDKVIVSVLSNINFDQKNEVHQLVEPVLKDSQSGIPIAVQEIAKSFSGQGGVPGGVVGSGPGDIAGYPGSEGGESEYEETNSSVNYEINRITKEIQATPFSVKDLTINVGVEPPNANDPASLTEETKAAIQQVLSNIVRASLSDTGQSLTEEDITNRISVFPHTFDKRNQVQAAATSSWWLYGLGALGLLTVAGVGYSMVRRRNDKALEASLIKSSASGPKIELEMETADTSEMQMRRQLEQLAKRKPDEFAKLLRTWIAED